MVDHVPVVPDLIYDVGLHKGEDTAYYLAKGYRVVAFEANEQLVDHCRARFARAAPRLTIVHGAITDSEKARVPFYRHPLTAWGTINEDWVERNRVLADAQQVEEVPAVRLADVIRTTGMPSFMKIDIEGSDLICLRELLTFEHRPVSLSIESNKTEWSRLVEEFSLLDELGYDRFAVTQQATIPRSEVQTQTLDGSTLRYRFEHASSGGFGSDVDQWVDREAALRRYRRIFMGYRARSRLVRGKTLHRALAKVQMTTHRPLPGWFDTHAANGGRLDPPVFWKDSSG